MKKGVAALGVALMCVFLGSITYEKTVSSRTDFMQEIRKFPRAVVIFYESRFDTKEETKEYRKKFKDARRAFDSVSKNNRYKDSSIAFLRVDLDKKSSAEKGSTEEIAKRYGVDTLPTTMLFFNGKPLTTKQGTFVQRMGFLEKDDIIKLIERHFGKDINGILQERARLRQREREESMSSGWSPYFYWGYGGGYPYGYPYYYAPGYGSAGFGITIGG